MTDLLRKVQELIKLADHEALIARTSVFSGYISGG